MDDAVDELIGRWLAGELHGAAAARLAAAVQRDPAVAQRLREELATVRDLRTWWANEHGEATAARVMHLLANDAGSARWRTWESVQRRLPASRRRPRVRARHRVLVGVATLGALLAIALWWASAPAPAGPWHAERRTHAGAWVHAALPPPHADLQLAAGEELRLRHDASGSHVHARGPGRVRFADDEEEFRVHLRRGRLAVALRAPRPVSALRILTPHAQVALTGTRVAVTAEERRSHVAVASGTVEVRSGAQPPLRIAARQEAYFGTDIAPQVRDSATQVLGLRAGRVADAAALHESIAWLAARGAHLAALAPCTSGAMTVAEHRAVLRQLAWRYQMDILTAVRAADASAGPEPLLVDRDGRVHRGAAALPVVGLGIPVRFTAPGAALPQDLGAAHLFVAPVPGPLDEATMRHLRALTDNAMGHLAVAVGWPAAGTSGAVAVVGDQATHTDPGRRHMLLRFRLPIGAEDTFRASADGE